MPQILMGWKNGPVFNITVFCRGFTFQRRIYISQMSERYRADELATFEVQDLYLID
jgi:hypothetical protein